MVCRCVYPDKIFGKGFFVHGSHRTVNERLEQQEIWSGAVPSKRDRGCSALHGYIEEGREAVSDW